MEIKPKFKVGDDVYYIACINKSKAEFTIMHDKIHHIEIGIWKEGVDIEYKLRENYNNFIEDRLHTSKNEAINSLIEKLENMKDKNEM